MLEDPEAPRSRRWRAWRTRFSDGLPARFRELSEGVIIRVDDFPTDEVLDEMDAESEFDLLGLFQGTGVPFRSHDDIARLPKHGLALSPPILDYWAEHEETLGDVVRHVLVHEIGHHFGLSDDDMAEIEADAEAETEMPTEAETEAD